MDRFRQTVRRKLLGGLLGAAWGLAAPAVLRAESTPFRFGLTPVFLNNDSGLLARLQGWLEGALGRPVRFVQRRTYREITNLALVGDLDAAWICGYPWLDNRAALALVAVPLWRGRPLYQSYLIERAGGAAADLSDLRGNTYAFSDPDSNSGYLVTVSDLIARGDEPEGFFTRTFFTYGHRNVVRAVGSGLAQSGSVDGYVWEALARTEPELPAATRIVAQSEWIGHPPIVCPRAQAGSADIAAFRQALLTIADDPDGRAALDLLQLDGFVPGAEDLFDPIARRMALLTEEE
ncbi:MAG: PhnD/SsuA/transferrin family substrate-binding protein [Paracoccaceae bacterium]|jgi:phosphonate transport system substrate-binding protein|nr:PhnD/SsuA/transferrin family substrate-binding protein [Paracoccaceae bacterium]